MVNVSKIALNVVHLNTKGVKKFGVASGATVVIKTHTPDQAQNAINNHRELLETWAVSAVSVDSSDFTILSFN